MFRMFSAFSLFAMLVSSASAADLSARQKADLDSQVLTGQKGYTVQHEPYFAAPPTYYRKKLTTRTCIDDGDGMSCVYDHHEIR